MSDEFLPELPHIHRVYMVLADPTNVACMHTGRHHGNNGSSGSPHLQWPGCQPCCGAGVRAEKHVLTWKRGDPEQKRLRFLREVVKKQHDLEPWCNFENG